MRDLVDIFEANERGHKSRWEVERRAERERREEERKLALELDQRARQVN